MRSGKVVALAGLAAACLFGIGAFAQNQHAAGEGFGNAGATPPSWRVPLGDLKRGEALAQTCLSCHGGNPPEGTSPPPPRLFRQRASYIFFTLREYREGLRRSEVMAPFAEGLSDQDMRDVAVFFSQGMPDQVPKPHKTLPGYLPAVRECGICHGETGAGEFEGMPVLTGQDPAYLAAALAAFRRGERPGDSTMTDVVKQVDPKDDAAVVQYFASYQWLGDKE